MEKQFPTQGVRQRAIAPPELSSLRSAQPLTSMPSRRAGALWRGTKRSARITCLGFEFSRPFLAISSPGPKIKLKQLGYSSAAQFSVGILYDVLFLAGEHPGGAQQLPMRLLQRAVSRRENTLDCPNKTLNPNPNCSAQQLKLKSVPRCMLFFRGARHPTYISPQGPRKSWSS